MEIKKGKLTVIAGCVSSGKTLELIRRVTIAKEAKKSVIVFKPKRKDNEKEAISSKFFGATIPAILINSPAEMLLENIKAFEVVAIDEAHFFEKSLRQIIEILLSQGIDVIVSALDTDFRGEPFGQIAQLLAIAEERVHTKAICAVCGREAIRTQRLIEKKPAPINGPIFLEQDSRVKYEPRCLDCHLVPKK